MSWGLRYSCAQLGPYLSFGNNGASYCSDMRSLRLRMLRFQDCSIPQEIRLQLWDILGGGCFNIEPMTLARLEKFVQEFSFLTRSACDIIERAVRKRSRTRRLR